MMDVKDMRQGGVSSVTTMLVRHAIAKNHEMKEMLVKPVREDDSQKVDKAADSSRKSEDTPSETDQAQTSSPNGVGKLVNVSV